MLSTPPPFFFRYKVLLGLEQGYDFLNVFDGDRPLASLSGTPTLPLELSASSGRMRLIFTSDGSIQGPGFVARYDSHGVGGPSCASGTVARLLHAPRTSSTAGMPIEAPAARLSPVWLGALAAVCVAGVIVGIAMRRRSSKLGASPKASSGRSIVAPAISAAAPVVPEPISLFGEADDIGTGEDDDEPDEIITLPTSASSNHRSRITVLHAWADVDEE